MPIIELAKALKATSPIELWADDPAAGPDLEAFCAATGNQLVKVENRPCLRAVVAAAGRNSPR